MSGARSVAEVCDDVRVALTHNAAATPHAQHPNVDLIAFLSSKSRLGGPPRGMVPDRVAGEKREMSRKGATEVGDGGESGGFPRSEAAIGPGDG